MEHTHANRLLLFFTVFLVAVSIALGVLAYQQNRDAADLAEQRRVDRNEQLAFVCQNMNQLGTGFIEVVTLFRSDDPRLSYALRLLREAKCDPADLVIK